jgi:hypothetical protein
MRTPAKRRLRSGRGDELLIAGDGVGLFSSRRGVDARVTCERRLFTFAGSECGHFPLEGRSTTGLPH